MSHEVETMAWKHAVPWHRLGREVAPDAEVDEMVAAAEIDWTVSKRPIFYASAAGEAIAIKDTYALVRDTDDRHYSIVGRGWHPVQNRVAMEFFRAFVAAGGASMETVGALRHGQIVWGLANLKAGFTLPGGDSVKGYLLLASFHEQGKANIARVTPIRVVCANTLAMAMGGSARFEQRFSHVREFDPHEAAATVGAAREQIVEYASNARLLKKLRMTDEEVVRLLAPVYARDEDPEALVATKGQAHRTLKKVMDCYTSAPGADPGTGWGALNASTYYADHVARREGDSRLTSAWLGKESRRKNQVLSALLELAR